MKQVASSLKIELANYRELQAFSQFGSDLDASTKAVLNHGSILMEILKQNQYDTYPVDRQIIELFAAKHKYLEDIPLNKIKEVLAKLYSHLCSSHKKVIDEIKEKKIISPELEASLKDILKKYFDSLK